MSEPPQPPLTARSPAAAPTGAASLRHALGRLDWQFLRSTMITTLGIVVARVLGFFYSFLVAQAFSLDDFGAVQYTITLATLAGISTVPFAEQVLPWFISRHRAEPKRLREIIRHAWLVLLALYGATLLVALPVLTLMGRPPGVVLVIFTGVTFFNVYLGLARGFIAPGRMLLAYLGSNLLQLAAVLAALRLWGSGSTTPVLLIYGLAYMLPIVLLELLRPFPASLGSLRFQRATLRELLRFAAPVWGSHALYTLSFALDILLLERFWDEATVGQYALTKTIVMGFSFVPQGITVMLMPRVASGALDHRRLLAGALLATATVSAVALLVYAAVYEWFITSFVGAPYFAGLTFALLMASSAIIYGVHAILTSYLVGRSRPGLETVSRGVMGLALVASGLLLIPGHGLLGAAWANVICAVTGVLVYAALLGFERLRPRSAGDAS